MKKQEKTFFVQNLTEELKAAKSTVVVNYSGLTVQMQQELKKKLRAVGAKMMVAKNTLFSLAAEEAKLPKEVREEDVLSGQNAYILAEEDPIAPLQVISDFSENYDVPKLKVGIIEGTFQDTNTLVTLSKLPSREILLSQTTGAIGAPIYGLLGTMKSNMQKLVYVLEQASKNK